MCVMKPIKNQIFLILLILPILLSSTALTSIAFASDKPVWTIDYKKLNLPKYTLLSRDKTDPKFNIHFTADNKIFVSFLQYRTQAELTIKDTPKKFDAFFVALLLSIENGKLISRVEWPVTPESDVLRQTRVYPLPSGGYVGIINRLDFSAEDRKIVTHLQTFDASFNVIHDRVLDTLPSKSSYDIIVPLSGKFIVLCRRGNDKRFPPYENLVEIIDSDMFEIIERFELPDFKIVDIWQDRLLSRSYADMVHEGRYVEKKIGASQWNDIGLGQGEYAEAKYIYNGATVVQESIYNGFILINDNIKFLTGPVKRFWVVIEDGKKSDPLKGCISTPSWNTSVVACKRNETSATRSFFDLFGKGWIEAYDLNTRQVLLATKAYTPDSISGEDIVDYAVSPDGNSIVLMTSKKIELYNVNSKKDKKK